MSIFAFWRVSDGVRFVRLFFESSGLTLTRIQTATLWRRLEDNAPFYFSANDYLDPVVPKTEPASDDGASSVLGKRKRPTRAAGRTAPSYAEVESDSDSEFEVATSSARPAKTVKKPAHLETWIEHLALLQREEEAKVCDFGPATNTVLMQGSGRQRGAQPSTTRTGS